MVRVFALVALAVSVDVACTADTPGLESAVGAEPICRTLAAPGEGDDAGVPPPDAGDLGAPVGPGPVCVVGE